ncbi:MAG: AzlD domain-containing protein [Gammaproteobacteria bacterium]|nr:AzlD domain-containing protein [Gammaproteobacteria bacterium]
MNYLLLIAAMMAVTFLPRYLPFYLASKLQLPHSIEQALNYVPIAVLTIIVVQTSLFKEGQLALSADNPYIAASAVAFIVALLQKRLFVTISAGLVSYAVLQYWLSA